MPRGLYTADCLYRPRARRSPRRGRLRERCATQVIIQRFLAMMEFRNGPRRCAAAIRTVMRSAMLPELSDTVSRTEDIPVVQERRPHVFKPVNLGMCLASSRSNAMRDRRNLGAVLVLVGRFLAGVSHRHAVVACARGILRAQQGVRTMERRRCSDCSGASLSLVARVEESRS